MKLMISNRAEIANKHIRFAKWKFYSIYEKFDILDQIDLFLDKEGSSLITYKAVLKIKANGKEKISSKKDSDLNKLLKNILATATRNIRKMKSKHQNKFKTIKSPI